jgi:hypothetical protein
MVKLQNQLQRMWFEIPTIFLNVQTTNLLSIQNLSILMMLVSENYLFYKIIDPFRWCLCRLEVTQWVSLVEQELLTFQEHQSSPPLFTRVCVAQSLFRTLWGITIKIFLFETICSIRTKFWWNSHWMVLFQKCVRRFGPSTKMAPTADFRLNIGPYGKFT